MDLLGIKIFYFNFLFNFLRYENLESAIDACARMKNFNFGNEKYITVDFTK